MIFNFFKSKPYLKDLISTGFVDIHSHVLPGIDDGAKNTKESVQLISEMKKLGFSKIIGTPHTYPGLYENTNESIKKSFEILHRKIPKNICIDYASEYMLEESIIDKARNKNLLCIKDNYVLVEMSFISEPVGLYEIIYELRVNGYIPVLAHPERYLFLNNKNLLKLKKFGCLLQGNLLSITDYYGVHIRKNLEKLISKKLIDFMGSDIHHNGHVLAFEKKENYKKIDDFCKIIENNNLLK